MNSLCSPKKPTCAGGLSTGVSRLLRGCLLALALAGGMFGSKVEAATILIHQGVHWDWYTDNALWNTNAALQNALPPFYTWMDNSFSQILADWGLSAPQNKYYFYVNPVTGGGFATGDIGQISTARGASPSPGIGVSYDAFLNAACGIAGFWGYAIGTHENVNLLTGQAMSGGWPRDWWADDKSPFPAMTAVRVEAELGRTDISNCHDASFNDPLYTMMKNIQAHYGWGIFQRMFAQIQTDSIHWTSIDSGANPSAILTAYVTGYMFMGSRDSSITTYLDNQFVTGGIPNYDVNKTLYVKAAHDCFVGGTANRTAFLSGDYAGTCTTPDFTISAPAALSIPQGSNATVTITVNYQNGLSGAVNLSASGLPSGVTASFNPPSLTASGTSALTLTASGSARSGAAILSVTGTSGSLQHSMTVDLTVTGLVGYWAFDAGSGATATDSSGNSNTGTLVNGPTWVAPGKVGAAALSFNASSLQRVSVNNSSSLNPTAAITMAAWINATDWNGNRRILAKGTGGGGDFQYELLASGGQLQFFLYGVGSLYTLLPATGAWVHLAATWDGSRMILYTNGIRAASQFATGAIATTSDPLFMASKNGGGVAGDYFNGKLDEVRLYNRALNPTEINALGGNGSPNFDLSASVVSLTLLQGSTVTNTITIYPLGSFSGSVNLSASGLPSGVTASFNPASTTSASGLTLTVGTNAATGPATVTVTGASGGITHTTTITLAILRRNPIGYWPFDEGSGTTAADASGNGNTGTLVNAPTWVAPGKVGAAALSFNASSLQRVSVSSSSSLNPTAAITLAAWIKATDWNGNRRILQKGNGDNQYRLLASGGVLYFSLTGVADLTTALPATGMWVHLAATWNGSTMILYTNGVQAASKAATGTIATTADPLAIGAKNGSSVGGDYFNGTLDDLRIYSRALSALEINQLISPPISLKVGPRSGGQFSFSFAGVNGYAYAIETSTNLMGWNSVLTSTPSGGIMAFTNTDATDPQRFYRVRH